MGTSLCSRRYRVSIPSRPLAALLALLALVAGGCTTWRRDLHALTPPIPMRRPLQIWTGNQSYVVHGVQLRGDSVRTVARWKSPECDSCSRFFARSAID